MCACTICAGIGACPINGMTMQSRVEAYVQGQGPDANNHNEPPPNLAANSGSHQPDAGQFGGVAQYVQHGDSPGGHVRP